MRTAILFLLLGAAPIQADTLIVREGSIWFAATIPGISQIEISICAEHGLTTDPASPFQGRRGNIWQTIGCVSPYMLQAIAFNPNGGHFPMGGEYPLWDLEGCADNVGCSIQIQAQDGGRVEYPPLRLECGTVAVQPVDWGAAKTLWKERR